MQARAEVDGKLACEGELMFSLVDWILIPC
jgi:3-hydroxymyristoyl/3-hydroxydecanoyl-(acyl carrier protein) dehydratase